MSTLKDIQERYVNGEPMSDFECGELLKMVEELEAQLAESDHALDCMTSSAGELQDVCDKLEKQLEAGLSVVDNAMLNEHVRRLLKTAIGEGDG